MLLMIYDPKGFMRYWIGHPDLIYPLGDPIYIVDYKPKKEFKENPPGKHFINLFLQIIAYGLYLQQVVAKDGRKVKCSILKIKML